jgi:hypothetical protein
MNEGMLAPMWEDFTKTLIFLLKFIFYENDNQKNAVFMRCHGL